MDWKCGDLLLGGGDMDDFRIEKTVKADKVSMMLQTLLYFDCIS